MTYIRATLSAANLNTTASAYSVNFGQFCDQPGVVDYCINPRFPIWETFTFSAGVNPDIFNGRVIDETGKRIGVIFSGGLSGSTVFAGGGNNNSQWSLALPPFAQPFDILQLSDTVPASGQTTFSWTFDETVRNPGLYATALTGTLSFYKADGVTPLPFVLRGLPDGDDGRQLDANTYYAPGAQGAVFQFIGETTAIVLKVASANPGTAPAFPFAPRASVFLGCNGMATTSSNTLNTDTDGDGVSDLGDKCPDTPAGAVVGSDGCPLPTDLSIAKSASVTQITPGVPFNYTITVTNTGAEANNVKASDIIPAGLTINSSAASDSGVVTTNSQTVEALWAIVPAGGVRTLTINVTKP
ncbi:MAG: hypothetical protein V4726_24140 [Verrucomicrobiota bacterium]